MRHRVAHRKLGRVTEHRIALLRNQAEALIRHERIETTVPKAKELRPFVERLITIAKRGLAEGPKTDEGACTRKRLVAADVHKPETVDKLFDTIAPRFAARPGGYTRILKLGFRRGDAADMAQIELVGQRVQPEPREGIGGPRTRLPRRRPPAAGCKSLAARFRGKKAEGAAPEKKAKAHTKAEGGGPKKGSTPRKAGGA